MGPSQSSSANAASSAMPDQNPYRPFIPTSSALRRAFLKTYGHLTAHAERDHRAATSMVPRVRRGGNRPDVPLARHLRDILTQSPELLHWAEDPPSAERKLLIVQLAEVLGVHRIVPSGWHTAEILNKTLPGRLHGRRTITLHHWCAGKSPSVLLPSLVMQLISSPVFNECASQQSENERQALLETITADDSSKLSARDMGYLFDLLKRLLELVKDKLTVYCVIDSLDAFELRASAAVRDTVLTGLLGLVKESCGSAAGGLDFRLLLLYPQVENDVINSAENPSFKETVAECGVVLHPVLAESDTMSEIFCDLSEESDWEDSDWVSSKDSWHTARECSR